MTRLIWIAVCGLCGHQLFHAWQAGVELTADELVVHDVWRTHAYPWTDLALARLDPPKEMRTTISGKPLRTPWVRRRWPSLALTVEFEQGGSRQFYGVSAPESAADELRSFLVEVNRRIKAAKLPE